MKLSSEDGFRAKGLGWAVQEGPGDWVHRRLCRDAGFRDMSKEMSISLTVL